MSLSSIGSSNAYSYIQQFFQSDSTDPGNAAEPSDPLQSLYQAFSGAGSADPPAAGDSNAPSNLPPFSPDVMQALLSMQGDQANSGISRFQSLFGKFDTDNNGQISQSEFEQAIGPNADQSKVDALFNKLDANGDGAVSQGELQSALRQAHGGHHHHHHADASQQATDPLQALLASASADGATSQSSTNADGSTTTTLTYADGTKVEMTVPAASNAAAAGTNPSDPNALNFSNLLKQLIGLQAQMVAPTTNLSV
ncbi:MAG: EF-hand domain-containing protein [Rhizobiales bacterium]|jgi:hypothetical protein|nr:EF-hand domain-containing protein [Hyphomicrobiales bacterium]